MTDCLAFSHCASCGSSSVNITSIHVIAVYKMNSFWSFVHSSVHYFSVGDSKYFTSFHFADPEEGNWEGSEVGCKIQGVMISGCKKG